MWSAVVVGTYPSDTAVEVWLALQVGERDFGCLPGFRLQIKPPNQLWHVPIPPMGVEQRLRYRAFARLKDGHVISSDPLDAVVRANLPERGETDELTLPGGTALVGNRQMTARVDARGVTTDVYYPTVGLHSNVRPAEGDQPRSRTNFQAILGGLALGQRIDWFHERTRWNATQRYREDRNPTSWKQPFTGEEVPSGSSRPTSWPSQAPVRPIRVEARPRVNISNGSASSTQATPTAKRSSAWRSRR